MSKESPFRTTAPNRRTVLGGIAGLGALAVAGSSIGAAGKDEPMGTKPTDGSPHTVTGADSHHPGHPRFVHVGDRIVNPAWVNLDVLGSRDNIAPRLTEISQDPAEYGQADFEWSLAEQPDGSEATVQFATPEQGIDRADRYDHGTDNVAELVPDEPGRYVLDLDAPDGTHQLTVHAFPEPPTDPSGPPRIELDGSYDSETGVFTIETNPQLAADSNADADAVEIHALADDRDALATADIEVDDETITVPESALGGELGRVHAVAYDGEVSSMLDTIELVPGGDSSTPSVSLPNRPPEWLEDGVMYQIFPRSWAGERGATDFDVLIGGDESTGARGLDYLDELGVDVLWLTPIVPAVSVERNDPPNSYAGGGPHGYDTLDYFGIAEDLVPDGTDPIAAYQTFVDACHERDIKVMFDLVINHAGRDIDLFQSAIAEQDDGVDYWPRITEWDDASRFFHWWDRAQAPLEASAANENYEEGVVIEPEPHVTGFFDLQAMPNFNYDNLEVREHLLSVVDFWSGEVGVDGFRCDIAWGVPHSFWKEAREVALRNNDDFAWLDETIPKEPEFTENEFDIHFDSDGDGFTNTTHAVAREDTHGGGLFDTIASRSADGFPDHTLFLNIVENHDEHRLLNQAIVDLENPNHDEITDQEWEAGARLQRLTWAAGVFLPGVPGIYYGQERQISRYGQGRHLGEGDPRGFNEDGTVNPSADVRPGGRQRAFMNWEQYPESHLQFYKDVVGFYRDHDVLKPGASLEPIWFDAADDTELLLFGRDGTDLDGDLSPERVIVIVNFEDGAAEVDITPEASTVDLFTGTDVGVESDGSATTVSVEDFVVLETTEFGVTDELLAEWSDPQGDDHGPGSYTYPTSDDFTDGAFDIRSVDLYEGEEQHRFVVEVEDLTNPWGFEAGYSLQYLQLYVHDPEAPQAEASAFAAEGVNAAFERDCHRRIHANGEWGAWIDDGTGEFAYEAETSGSVEENRIEITVPAEAFEADLADLEFAPLLMGFDGNATGGVRPVTADGGEWQFGGGADDTSNPNVIDVVTPDGVDNAEALSYGPEVGAVVPLLSVLEGIRNRAIVGDHVETLPDSTGDDAGPGEYTYPTTDQIPEGSLDLDAVSLYEGDQQHTAVFRFAQELTNEFDLSNGFSHQYLQLYLRNPDADGSVTGARAGVNADLSAPYQYWLFAHGDAAGLEAADGTDLGEVAAEPITETNEIAVRFPATPFETPLETMEVVPLVCGYDGFASNGIRPVTADGGEWQFGGADPEETAPNVIDLLTPAGTTNAEALAYDETTRASIPYVDVDASPFEYANQDGHVGTSELRTAVQDWQRGEVDTDTLLELIESWQSGEPLF